MSPEISILGALADIVGKVSAMALLLFFIWGGYIRNPPLWVSYREYKEMKDLAFRNTDVTEKVAEKVASPK